MPTNASNAENVKSLIDNGANVIVAGSSVFKSENPSEIIKSLKGDLSDL